MGIHHLHAWSRQEHNMLQHMHAKKCYIFLLWKTQYLSHNLTQFPLILNKNLWLSIKSAQFSPNIWVKSLLHPPLLSLILSHPLLVQFNLLTKKFIHLFASILLSPSPCHLYDYILCKRSKWWPWTIVHRVLDCNIPFASFLLFLGWILLSQEY